MSGHLALAVSTVLYGLGIVAQTVAARRADERPGTGVGLLARLAADRLYLLGFTGQVGGFLFAFLAREELPLYLVQAGSSSAVGIATVIGVLLLGWRIRRVEIAVLLVMACGLLLLTGAAAPSEARELPLVPALVVLGVLTLAVLPLARVFRTMTPVFAGIAFAVVAVAARNVAGKPPLDLLLHPLTWVMVIAAFVGQACLATALQRGSATSAVASMDATSVVLGSAAGLAVMGDQITPGREWWVALGILLVVSGVLVLGSAARKPAAELVPAAGER
jgi:drug/metabolite transporter (DMT)-like permease